jgi:lipopolysaccharide transport system permease protein
MSTAPDTYAESAPGPAPPPKPSARPGPAERVLVLEPGRAERNYWSDLWAYRELFAILAWRDLAVRYKQTVIGVAWAVIRPALTVLIFTVVFGRIAKLPSEGQAPYPLMVFAGMMPWTLFSSILSDGSASLVGNANLIGKVYFPRLIVPSAVIVVALVDYAVTLVLFFLMMAWFRFMPDWRLLFLPVFTVLAVLASLGPALWLTALNVKYRDFRYLIPFVLQFGLYVSPVGFATKVIPPGWRLLYDLNPVVGVINGFRWCLLAGQAELDPLGMTACLVVTAGFLWLGISYFRRTERTFADLL